MPAPLSASAFSGSVLAVPGDDDGLGRFGFHGPVHEPARLFVNSLGPRLGNASAGGGRADAAMRDQFRERCGVLLHERCKPLVKASFHVSPCMAAKVHVCKNPGLRSFQAALRGWLSQKFKKGGPHQQLMLANDAVLSFTWSNAAELPEPESTDERSGLWHVSVQNRSSWEVGMLKLVKEHAWTPAARVSAARGRTAVRACWDVNSDISRGERLSQLWPSCLGAGNAHQVLYAPADQWERSCHISLWRLVCDDEILDEMTPSCQEIEIVEKTQLLWPGLSQVRQLVRDVQRHRSTGSGPLAERDREYIVDLRMRVVLMNSWVHGLL